MYYFWKIPPEYQDLPTPHFSQITAAVCGFLAVVIALLIGGLTLDSKALTTSVIIWRFLAFPALLVLIVYTVAVIGFLINYCWFSMAQESYKLNRQYWQLCASSCLRLADHHSLFPVDNAALKMIGLEGEMPAAKDIPRILNICEDEQKGLSRSQQTIKILLEQLDTRMINQRNDRPEVWLYLRNASDSTHQDAETILRHYFPILSQSTLHILGELPERALLEEWTEQEFSGFRLLIVVELHSENDDDFCEFASALLFSGQRQLPDTRMPVWCFRSVDSKQHRVGKYLKILFAAEQIKLADLRHVWTGNLKGESLNLLRDAFTEVETGVKSHQWHSMRLAETWTPGYQWLMLEWSACAIRNGQRGQLLASEQRKNQQINLAVMSSEKLPHHVDKLDHDGLIGACLKLIPCLMILIGLEGLLLYMSLFKGLLTEGPLSGWWFVVGPGVIVFFMAIIVFGTSSIYRSHLRIIDRYYLYE